MDKGREGAMSGSPRARVVVIVACVVMFVTGAVMVYRALDTSPPSTPTPGEDIVVSAEDARSSAFDDPIPIPSGDFGEFVNREPVVVPSAGDPAAQANHLYIPSLRISAPVMPQGVTSANEMSLPSDLSQVGWLDTTSELDAETGSSLLAGHVTYGGVPGTLYFLGLSEPGMAITTVDAAQEQTEWVVTSVRSYRKTSLPPEIFATDGARTLTLVTCGGQIIRTPDGRWTHEDNIVVVAVPVQ